MKLAAVLIFLAAACLAAPALAHAMLERADPRVGSVHNAPPGEIHLQFTEAVEPAFSHVTLKTGDGKIVPTASVAVLATDHHVLIVKPAQPLAVGLYHVMWQVVSVDTHRTEGDFCFSVGK
jgi:methionine-rich copper-binding protein CopC